MPLNQLIGFEPQFDINAAASNYVASLNDSQNSATDRLHSAEELVFLAHMGYPGLPGPEEVIQQGVDIALEYFFGPLDDRQSREYEWFMCFAPGLLLGLLSQRWEDVGRLCSFVQLDMEPEFQGDVEYEAAQIYLLIANALRPDPQPGAEKLEKAIGKCRLKRPRLLLKLWQAGQRGTQEEFDQALRESLQHYQTRTRPSLDATFAGEWIAWPQNAICLAAMQLGKKLPALPENLSALLVTRESLGLKSKS